MLPKCTEHDWGMTVLSNRETAPVTARLVEAESDRPLHRWGGLHYEVLAAIETHLGSDVLRTAETGCGRSTILFSNLARFHTTFCLDDTVHDDTSSVRYFETSELFKPEAVTRIYGPTQQTLPAYKHAGFYDCVLIDGPHGYPFPDLEYYFFYPKIRQGGLLVLDDVQIASIGRMADILQEDAMWDLVELVETTAIFRRTFAPTVSETGDDWWEQGYNQRRTTPDKRFFDGSPKLKPFEERLAAPLQDTSADQQRELSATARRWWRRAP